MNAKELRKAADIALEQINFGFPVSDERIATLAEHILSTVLVVSQVLVLLIIKEEVQHAE